MMISPEGYYEEYLKGKTATQIMTAIRSLKNKIGHLKNVMEHPDYGKESIMHPCESTCLNCSRLYLERAKQALYEVGGIYTLSKAEIKAADFEASIPSINRVVFSIGGFFGGYETRICTLENEHLYFDIDPSPDPSQKTCTGPDLPYGKAEFLESIRELHIGEWRSRYDLRRFGYMVMDGTQWSLEINFSDGHKPVKIYGDNAYPYNFDELQELFRMDYDTKDVEYDD